MKETRYLSNEHIMINTVKETVYKRLHLVGQWLETGGGICEFKLFRILIKMPKNLYVVYVNRTRMALVVPLITKRCENR